MFALEVLQAVIPLIQTGAIVAEFFHPFLPDGFRSFLFHLPVPFICHAHTPGTARLT